MITTDRSQLYREVWEDPVRTVATKYHISDVALAKLCRRHHIPCPRVATGPSFAPGSARDGPNPPEALTGQAAQLIEAENLNENRIEVPDQLIDPHALVAKAAKSLDVGRADTQGIVAPRAKPRLDIRVSRPCIDRALRIIDALCKALEARGYPVEVDGEGKWSTSAVILEKRVFFVLEEQTKRAKHKPTAQERLEAKIYSWKKWPEYDQVLAGTLRLRIVDTKYLAVRTTWADGTKQRIENCLNAFIVGALKVAEAMKRRRIEHIEWEKRRREDEARRFELRQQEWLEETRQRELEQQAEVWEKVVRIRMYIDRAREAGVVYLPESVKMTSLPQWLEWATRYADSIDPFRPQEMA